MLKEKIDQDLNSALKSKDTLTADTLRMLKARIKNDEIAKQKEYDDAQIIEAIFSEVKRRKDSVQAYTSGNRPELAQKEQNEIALLQKYLPAQLGAAEVSVIIDQALAGQSFAAADFGKAMSLVMPKLKGQADGGLVAKILKEKLEQG